MLKTVSLVCLAVLIGCGLQSKDDDKDGEGDDGLSLTVPESDWAKSNFCGDLKPEVPENPVPPYRFDHAFLSEKLAGDGLTGWIHGAVPSYKQYVFTYRKEDPNDFMAFFKAEQFSLVPDGDGVAEALAAMKRHDKVRLKGEVFANGSPLTHIKVKLVEVLTKFDAPTENTYAFDLARLGGKTRFPVFGLVHTTVQSDELGRAIVLEHGDFILPIAVPAVHDALAAPLYRGDIVEAHVKVVQHPHGPPHFELDAEHAAPLKVIDSMVNCHGKETTVEGYLALFKKSPAISRDVYAVRVVDANGIGRNYTLFPATEDEDEFMAIFEGLWAKAAAAWDAASEAPAVVRNFWKKESVKVSVKGRLNVVSTEQANAQVYIGSVDDLVIK